MTAGWILGYAGYGERAIARGVDDLERALRAWRGISRG